MIELKSWPLAFGQIIGKMRHHDCRLGLGLDVKPGNVLLYREYSPMTGMYSGREAEIVVGAVTRGQKAAFENRSPEFDPLNGIAQDMTIFTIASVRMLPSKPPTPELEHE